MDGMDIDHIVEVPDTPDRLTARRYFQRSSDVNRCRNTLNHSEQQRSVEEVNHVRPTNTENGKKRRVLCLPKPSSSSSNSLHPKNMPIDLTESPIQRPEARKWHGLANGPSSPHGPNRIPIPVGDSSVATDNTIIVGSVIGNGNREGSRIVDNGQMKNGNIGVVPVDSSASPVINRQRRLVRNGCISPNNIAKAKESSGKEINGPVAVVQNNNASLGSSSSPVCSDIMDLVADDNHSYKGKGKTVVSQPYSSKETNSRNKYLPGRSSLSINDKPEETNYFNKGMGTRIEEADGWISTRNRKTNISSSDADHVIVSELSDCKYSHQPQHTRTGRENGISNPDINNVTQNPNLSSSDHSVVSQPLVQPRSNLRLAPHVRRRMLESDLSRFAECSTSARDDPEIVLLSSSGEPSTSRVTSRRVDNLQPVIQVEDYSPDLRNNRNVEDVRARQLEADARLAHELQEQFYNETPAFGAEELDQHIAMALQHQDDGSAPLPHRSRRPVSNARGPRAPNVNRESQVRSRGSRIRGQAALGRMTRHRSQFPGVGRTTLLSAGGASLFPSSMDIEMRMNLLGEMEATVTRLSLLRTQRDFNENDYEMLLALDENNDQRCGASSHVINGLPQSTVQSTTYDETCAVCLETPTIGDTIRHLPCLHKFHKDCIDPWLTRKTSCPICKSSVTVT